MYDLSWFAVKYLTYVREKENVFCFEQSFKYKLVQCTSDPSELLEQVLTGLPTYICTNWLIAEFSKVIEVATYPIGSFPVILVIFKQAIAIFFLANLYQMKIIFYDNLFRELFAV